MGQCWRVTRPWIIQEKPVALFAVYDGHVGPKWHGFRVGMVSEGHRLTINQSINQSIYISIYLSIYLSIFVFYLSIVFLEWNKCDFGWRGAAWSYWATCNMRTNHVKENNFQINNGATMRKAQVHCAFNSWSSAPILIIVSVPNQLRRRMWVLHVFPSNCCGVQSKYVVSSPEKI